MGKLPRHDRASAGDGNLIARAKAAGAIRADFERQVRSSLTTGIDVDWLTWASRLSAVLGEMLALLEGPGGAITVLFPDGGAFLAADDVRVALAALRLATTTGDPLSVLFRSLTRRLGNGER
jgi:hypothetical protein